MAREVTAVMINVPFRRREIGLRLISGIYLLITVSISTGVGTHAATRALQCTRECNEHGDHTAAEHGR